MTSDEKPIPLPPTVDHLLTGAELQIVPGMVARVVWALKRYSSLTYLRRMFQLYKSFIGGVEDWAKLQNTGEDLAFAREVLRRLYISQGEMENGLFGLERGRKIRAYEEIWRSLEGLAYINGRRFDDGIFWEFAGWKGWDEPAVGLFSWAERASSMASRVRLTLSAGWTFEMLLGLKSYNRYDERHFPPVTAPAPELQDKPLFKTGQLVPFTGIFVPTSFLGGCPNFLVQGWRAPQATRTYMRKEYLPFVDYEGKLAPAEWEVFENQVDAEWQPLWRDDRYGKNKEPDPPEYLNVDTEFPPDPPMYPPDYTPAR